MKERFTANVINLRAYNIGEADKIIVMYSKERGIIRGVAKGIKKTTSKLGGRMDLFVANKMLLNKGRNLDTICQAEASNTFFHLRRNLDKLFYAMYCCEVVYNFGMENDPNSEETYNLFYEFLDGMSKAENIVKSLLCVIKFQLKIMDIAGYSIELEKCIKCAQTAGENMYFSIEQGGLLCSKCASKLTKKTKIPQKITEFLNTLLKEDFNTVTKYDRLADKKVCSACIGLLRKYIEYYSPKRFKITQIPESEI